MSTTFLDRPILDIRPDFKKPKSGVLDDFTYQSGGFGKATPWKVTAGPKRTVTMDFVFGDVLETKQFRKFFSDRAGRRTGFWLPIWLDEYPLTEDATAGDTVIQIDTSKLGAGQLVFGNYQYLALATWDKLETYQIAHVATGHGIETVTLEDPLVTDLDSGHTLCGGLLWARLAEDKIAFKHKTDLVCLAQVKFVELPMEYESAHAGSAKFHAYRITIGATVWRYVNWGSDITLGGDLWLAADITNGAIRSGIDFLADPLDLMIRTDDTDHPLRRFTNRLMSQEVKVEIFEADADAATIAASPLFIGRVESVPFRAQGQIQAKLSSAFRFAEQIFPPLQTVRLCNNRLFDGICGLSEETYTTAGTITAISASQSLPYVEATEFGTKATAESDPNWFALGKVVCGTEIRMCVGVSGSRLYLNAPFTSAAVSDAILAVAGCDKRIGTCNQKFHNLRHHMGFPYMPNVNPNLDALLNPKPSGGKKGG